MRNAEFMASPDLLTDDERNFLSHHGIPLDKVFDAVCLPKTVYGPLMKEGGYLLACRVQECYRGHALRTRHGHCVQCDPARIAFASRGLVLGDVYVAISPGSGLIKVGCAADADARLAKLANEGYGGQFDWRLVELVHVDRMGELEGQVHQRLRGYRHPVSYVRDGRVVECKELYNCLLTLASDQLVLAYLQRQV